MSFSSSFGSGSDKRARSAQSLSETLATLGFEQAQTQSYDWMTAYPDAHPLLEALQTYFSPASVLSAEEAEKARRVGTYDPHLSPVHLLQAAEPIMNASTRKSLRHQREEQLASAQRRLELLRSQKEALVDALHQKQSEKAPTRSKRERPRRSPGRDEFARYRSRTEALRQFMTQRQGEAAFDSELMVYSQRERKHCEDIAIMASHASQLGPEVTAEAQTCASAKLKKAISSFANIKARRCACEALLARDTAMITSLSFNDGKYLEMTGASMLPLIKDLRATGASALQTKIAKVSGDARDLIWHEITTVWLSEKMTQQEAYISAMQLCLASYIEQRLRVLCLKSAADMVLSQRDQLLASLEKASIEIQHDAPLCSETHVGVPTSSKPCSELSDPPQLAAVSFSADAEPEDFDSPLEELERTVFSSCTSEAASQISMFTAKIGSTNAWLELTSHPRFEMLVADLEDQVGKNTILLEALLAKRDCVLEGQSGSIRSPNRNWIRRIQGTRNPPPSPMSSSTITFG